MKRTLLLSFLLVFGAISSAQPLRFTKDINKQNPSSNPSEILATTNQLFVVGQSAQFGKELYVSDGTDTGTHLLLDINPGTASSNPELLTDAGSIVFFFASDDSGYALWKTNGTQAGTEKVYAITTTISSYRPNLAFGLNGKVYFNLHEADWGRELWVSDGTTSGTKRVSDIHNGTKSSSPGDFNSINGKLIFTATDSLHGEELWVSDGTSNGTQLLRDIRHGNQGALIRDFANFNGQLCFVAQDTASGREIWRTDGTDTGTKILVESVNGSASVSPQYLTASGNYLYFSGFTSASGRELWKTDGTLQNTAMIKELDFGSYGSDPISLVDAGGKLYFIGDVDHGKELFVSDGTASGTFEVRDLYPIQTDAQIAHMTAVDSTLFFRAHSSPDYYDFELYKSRGTFASTSRVKNIRPGDDASNPNLLTAFKGKLYFTADDGVHGTELWISDGTSSGTTLFVELDSRTNSSQIQSIHPLPGGGVVFNANDGEDGNELWTSQGDSASTVMVKNINTSTGASSNPEQFVTRKDKVFFVTGIGAPKDIYYTDGTNTGTDDINVKYTSSIELMTVVDTFIYFAISPIAYDDIYVYRTGTGSGQLRKLNPNGLGDKVNNFTPFGSKMFFTADDGNNSGNELWITDGSYAGTVLVKDINSGSSDANPAYLSAGKNLLYFAASDGSNGRELWKSDGTSGGTVMVKDINSGAAGSSIYSIFAYGDSVLFTLNDGTHGKELWFSDGSSNNTYMLNDIFSGASDSDPKNFTQVGDKVYFLANDSLHGEELWVTDGTASGTRMVKDIMPGTGTSSITEMIRVRDELYFVADDGVNGREIWHSDGTSNGTELLVEVLAGAESSDPQLLTLSGETLFFTADHNDYGRELWRFFTQCMDAQFDYTAVCEKDAVEFENKSDGLGKTISGYHWDFGNGDTASVADPKYTFPNSGVFDVSLTITDGASCSVTKSMEVLVPQSPEADFSIDDTVKCLGNAFAFANQSKVYEGVPSYIWTLSDGSSSFSKDHGRSFADSGIKVIQLKIFTSSNCADSISKTVEVLPKPITSNIIGLNNTTNSQDTFSVTPTAGSSYSWNLTGGGIASGQGSNEVIINWGNPPLTATLQVIETNSDGCQGPMKSKIIYVLDNTGIEENFHNLSLYPNPTMGMIYMEMDKGTYEIEVNDAQGKVVNRTALQGINGQIDLNHLPPGVYTILIRDDSGNQTTKKLVIQH